MAKDYGAFLDALGERESGGDYAAVNSLGYLGKYQFGELALIDVGYYVADGTAKNDWKPASWTGKDGVHSKNDFLADHAAQESAIRAYMDLQWSYLGDAQDYVGQTVHGVTVSASGLLAAAHLLGAGTVRGFLKSNGKSVPADAYGTSLTEYMNKFAHYKTPHAADYSDGITVTGGVKDDVLRGHGGDDVLKGGGGKDSLKGAGGDDLLDGGKGRDQLVGGAGADAFHFSTKLAKGKPDHIKDFKPGEDTIVLHRSVFRKLDKGALDDDAFVRGKKARDDDHHVVYDKKSGTIYYDKNGDDRGGVSKIATLSKKLKLTADDFLVV